MKFARKPLVLTDLARERPAIRDDDASFPTTLTSPRAKRIKKTKANTTARINQIVVRAAPTGLYAVEDPPREYTTARPPVDLHDRLQRSQTAPTRLHPPRTRTLEPLVRPARPRMENGRIAMQPMAARHKVEHEDEDATAPVLTRSNEKRLYGEMIDSEDVETLFTRLGLTRKDVWRLRKQFNDEDTDNTNTITLSGFFYLIHEEQRVLTKSVLRLAGPTVSLKASRLTLDEYLRCVATFATFTEPELFQFFFQVYCENAAMAESDLTKLGQDLQVLRTAFAGNVQIATGNAVAAVNQGVVAEGSLTFADFERFSRQHMVAFYPLLQIQRHVRLVGELGEAFWIQKRSEKVHVQQLLAYMKAHHGFQPPLPLRDRIWSFVLQRQTARSRVRDRAKQLHSG